MRGPLEEQFIFERLRGFFAGRALREFKVVGVQTTIPFHLQLFQERRFREGKFHTKFVDEEFNFKDVKAEHQLEAALLAAAMEFRRAEQQIPKYASPRPLSAWKMIYRERPEASR